LSQQDVVLADYILALGVLFLIPYLELTLTYALMRALYVAKARDGVAYACGELFDGFYAASRAVAQIFAQEKLSLADDARQWIINLVSDVRHQISNLRQF
jgi:hypothetical protein